MKRRDYHDLIINNQEWVIEKLQLDKDFFKKLSKGQNPPFLFLGCSDSRLPLNMFTKTNPGELFIHRNIANQASPIDPNFLAVLQYAVSVLKVDHIIVAGHYCCGGVAAAYEGNADGYVGDWIAPIRDTYLANKKELEHISDGQAKIDRLAEINVLVQVNNILKTDIISAAKKNNSCPKIHAWILDIYTGLIKELRVEN